MGSPLTVRRHDERYAVDLIALASILENLSALLAWYRGSRGASQRDVQRATGIDHTLISRIEAGNGCSLDNAVKLLRWMALG